VQLRAQKFVDRERRRFRRHSRQRHVTVDPSNSLGGHLDLFRLRCDDDDVPVGQHRPCLVLRGGSTTLDCLITNRRVLRAGIFVGPAYLLLTYVIGLAE